MPPTRPPGDSCPNSSGPPGNLGYAAHSTRESLRLPSFADTAAWAPKGQFLPGTSQAHGPGATGNSEACTRDYVDVTDGEATGSICPTASEPLDDCA